MATVFPPAGSQASLGGHQSWSREALETLILAWPLILTNLVELALTTTKGRGFLEVLKEARIEARKIVWPSNAETWQTTLIVMAVVVATSLLLWGIDSLFGWIVSAIIG